MSRLLLLPAFYAVLLALAGCAVPKPPPPKPPTPAPAQKQSYWKGDGVEGSPSILINLSEQRAHFFKGGTEVGQAMISSGKRGFETPTGEFKVIQKDRHHVSNLYGEFVDASGSIVQRNVDASKQRAPEGASFQGAKMPFFLRFHGGAGMHAGRLPGYAASHGCVRLPRFMAEHFFENAPLGTPVNVTGGAPVSASAKSPAKKSSAEPARTPAKPAETESPAPAPESVKKAEGEPEKKPEPEKTPEPEKKPEPTDPAPTPQPNP